eukprot:PhF_6_TR42668/c1_g2_i5/m.64323
MVRPQLQNLARTERLIAEWQLSALLMCTLKPDCARTRSSHHNTRRNDDRTRSILCTRSFGNSGPNNGSAVRVRCTTFFAICAHQLSRRQFSPTLFYKVDPLRTCVHQPLLDNLFIYIQNGSD